MTQQDEPENEEQVYEDQLSRGPGPVDPPFVTDEERPQSEPSVSGEQQHDAAPAEFPFAQIGDTSANEQPVPDKPRRRRAVRDPIPSATERPEPENEQPLPAKPRRRRAAHEALPFATNEVHPGELPVHEDLAPNRPVPDTFPIDAEKIEGESEPPVLAKPRRRRTSHDTPPLETEQVRPVPEMPVYEEPVQSSPVQGEFLIANVQESEQPVRAEEPQAGPGPDTFPDVTGEEGAKDDVWGDNSWPEQTEPVDFPFVPVMYTPETDDQQVRQSGLAWSAGIVFVSSVAFMLFLGWIADLLLGSSPWGLLGGIILGSVMGFVQFFRITSQIFGPKKTDPAMRPLMSRDEDEE